MIKPLILLIFSLTFASASLGERHQAFMKHGAGSDTDRIELLYNTDQFSEGISNVSRKHKHYQKGRLFNYQDQPSEPGLKLDESLTGNHSSKITHGLLRASKHFHNSSLENADSDRYLLRKGSRLHGHVELPKTVTETQSAFRKKFGNMAGSDSPEPVHEIGYTPASRLELEEVSECSEYEEYPESVEGITVPQSSSQEILRGETFEPVQETTEFHTSSQKFEDVLRSESREPVQETTESRSSSREREEIPQKESPEPVEETTESRSSSRQQEEIPRSESPEPVQGTIVFQPSSETLEEIPRGRFPEPVQETTKGKTSKSFSQSERPLSESPEPVPGTTKSPASHKKLKKISRTHSPGAVLRTTQSPTSTRKDSIAGSESTERVRKMNESNARQGSKDNATFTGDSIWKTITAPVKSDGVPDGSSREDDDFDYGDYEGTDSEVTGSDETDSEETDSERADHQESYNEVTDSETMGLKDQLHELPSHEDITGGSTASIKRMPYLAIVVINRYIVIGTLCTSAILAPKWVLTAAHCIYKAKIGNTVVIAGMSKTFAISYDDKVQVKFGVKFIAHPRYVPITKDPEVGNHDIALIKVAKPFFLDFIHVTTIRLRAGPWFQPSLQYNCTAAGYGQEALDSQSILLRLHYFKAVANHGSGSCPCIPWERKKRVVCLERMHPGEGVCVGDSGGPLVCNGQVVGVAARLELAPTLCQMIFARELKCGDKGTIDVYTYTCPYLNWIRRYVGRKIPAKPESCSAVKTKHNALISLFVALTLTLLKYLFFSP